MESAEASDDLAVFRLLFGKEISAWGDRKRRQVDAGRPLRFVSCTAALSCLDWKVGRPTIKNTAQDKTKTTILRYSHSEIKLSQTRFSLLDRNSAAFKMSLPYSVK